MNHFQVFITAFNAISPVVLLILLGYFLKQRGHLTPVFLKNGNWLVFHVCLPCLTFLNVYDIADFASINWSIVLFSAAMVIVLFVLGLITALVITKDPARRGVLWQCTFRSNFAIIGIPMASMLGGSQSVTAATLITSFTVPLFNIFGIIALSTFTGQTAGKRSLRSIVKSIVTNPLLIGIGLGMVCLGIRELQKSLFGQVVFSLKEDLRFLYTVLGYPKSMATPLALIIMGAQFEFQAVRGLWKEVAVGTLWRTVLAPVLGISCAIFFSSIGLIQCGPYEYPALIALFGTPVAIASAIMAGSMGGDEQLATQLVVWTSITSVPTLFIQAYLLLSTGLIAM